MSFLLLKFFGYRVGMPEAKRELFDAWVLDSDGDSSFPIREGFDEIEVYAEVVSEP